MTVPSALEAIRIEPPSRATAAVLWLHGLGADGGDFEPVVPELGLGPEHGVRFVFPHAPVRRISINHGMPMRGWYDVRDPDLTREQDEDGVRESARLVGDLLDREREGGLAPERLILAGFSQGGAIALHCGLRYPAALGGIVALSTYLPLADRLAEERHAANARVPVLLAHGAWDPVIPRAQGWASCERLRGLGHPVEWHEYPMPHSVCAEEVELIGAWVRARLTT